jgi:hypothetical protein
MALSAEQRRIRAQIAAHTRWARQDPREAMPKVRAGVEKHFLDEVDPDRRLPEAERQRRARAAMRAHMKRLALASSKARAARRQAAAS